METTADYIHRQHAAEERRRRPRILIADIRHVIDRARHSIRRARVQCHLAELAKNRGDRAAEIDALEDMIYALNRAEASALNARLDARLRMRQTDAGIS